MKKLFLILLLALPIISCDDDNDSNEASLGPVPKVLYERHVTEFFQAAAARGVQVQQIQPTVVWKKMPDLTPCNGMGLYSQSNKRNGITIEINYEMRIYENDLNFGYIIYREMAHILLDKPYANISDVVMDRCTNGAGLDNPNKEEQLDYLFNN
jgi:hypothetical protein